MIIRRTFTGLGPPLRTSWVACSLTIANLHFLQAAPLPLISGVEWQPLAAQVERVVQAATFIGEPFTPAEREKIDVALKEKDGAKLQDVLDARCLFGVQINAEMRVKVQQGP